MAFYTNSQGLKISYEEYGDPKNKTVLFFEGWPSPYEGISNPIKEGLDRLGYHTVVFNYRGFGASDSSMLNSMAWCALDAKELLEHLGIQNATFFSASMGVSAMLAYFKEYGTLYCDSVVIFDQPPCLTTREDWPYGRVRGQQDEKLLLKYVAMMFHNFGDFMAYDSAAAAPDAFPELDLPPIMKMGPIKAYMAVEDKSSLPPVYKEICDVAMGKMEVKMDFLAMIATFFDSTYQDYRDVVPTIQVPGLVFAPNPGSVNQLEGNLYYKEHWGGPVTFVELKPGTHYAIYDYSDRIVDDVDKFLKAL